VLNIIRRYYGPAGRQDCARLPTPSAHAFARDVVDDEGAARIRDCDFIFLAANSMLARNVVNRIAYQYLIPTVQVASMQ
jgi:hypothetical protein